MAENLDRSSDRIERIGEKGVGHREVVADAWIIGTPERPTFAPTEPQPMQLWNSPSLPPQVATPNQTQPPISEG